MVRALHIDHLGKAAAPLGNVVGDVRHEVGEAAVGLAHDAVLVVAVVRAPQPKRAAVLVGLAGRHQGSHGFLDLAFGIQRGFEVIVVETYPEGLQVDVLFAAQVGHGEVADRLDILDVAGSGDLAVGGVHRFSRQEIGGDIGDVLAVVGGFRPAGRARHQSTATRLHRHRQIGDLHPGVVVVELAGHRMAAGIEQRRQGVAQRTLAAMADVQRAGGVGRYELDQHGAGAAGRGAAEAGALGQGRAHHPQFRLGRDAQVDEAGPGDFGGGDHPASRAQGGGDRGGEFARILLERACQLHGDIAGKVAVGGDLGPVEHDGRHGGRINGCGRDERGFDRRDDFLFDCGKHGMWAPLTDVEKALGAISDYSQPAFRPRP